ncbi:hypothetical protein C8F01DRAFT_1086039 [Mycena amicta]|nr:hypothetical protein C8F01DRAFT_1086039 [Mycena amicta]
MWASQVIAAGTQGRPPGTRARRCQFAQAALRSADEQSADIESRQMVERIIETIADATNFKFFLVGGGPHPLYGGEIRTIHMSIGQNKATQPVSFPAWDKTHFDTNILGSYKRWLETAYTEAECAAAVMPLAGEDPVNDPSLLTMASGGSTAGPSKTYTRTSATSSNAVASLSKTKNVPSSNHKKTSSSIALDEDSDGSSHDSDYDTDGERLTAEEKAERDRKRRKAYAEMVKANKARNAALLVALDLKNTTSTPSASSTAKPRNPQEKRPVATGTPRRSIRNRSGRVSDAMDTSDSADVMEIETGRSSLSSSESGVVLFSEEKAASSSEEEVIEVSGAGAPADDNDDNDDMGGMVVPRAGILPPCPPEAPAWFRDVYPEFSSENLGGPYASLIKVFFAFEAALDWANGSGKLSTTSRPAQLEAWIKHARVACEHYCGIADTTANQALWRGRSEDGKPANNQAEGESWGLRLPGKNGMLNVIVSLYWWGCTEKKNKDLPSLEWMDATVDVTRVLEGICAEMGA